MLSAQGFRVAIWLSGLLIVVSCGSPGAVPRFPDGQGWVVSAVQSDDLLYDWDAQRIVAGSITVLIADGTSAVITPDTRLEGICQELVPAPAVAQPCWLQVGAATSEGSVDWATVLGVVGDNGLPETWNQDHDRYHAVSPGGRVLREVTADAMIFDSGLVLMLGASSPVVTDCPPGDDLESATGAYARTILDIDTGAVVAVSCLMLRA